MTQDGKIIGKPEKEGIFNFTVRVEDGAEGCSSVADKTVSITVSSTAIFPPLQITTPQGLPTGKVGVSYTFTLSGAGGKSPYGWSVNGGSLPNGLYLTKDGVITGTPSVDGEYSFTVQLVDGSSPQQEVSKELVITILPYNMPPEINYMIANPSIVPPNDTSMITCYASDPDNDSLTYSWTKTGGTISGSGSTITWTAPPTADTYTVTCNVSDGKGRSASKEVTITVNESAIPLSIITTSLPSGTVGVSYSATLSATGGKTPYNWSLINGSLPPGLSLSTSGIISSTPTTAGTYNFTVLVKDSSSPQQSASKALSIMVNPASTPTVTSVNPSNGSQGQTLNVTIIGTNLTGTTSISFGAGITVNSFTVSSVTQIIASISISSSASPGTRNVSVTTPAGTGTGGSLFTVTEPIIPLTITTDSLSSGTVGVSYNASLSANGGKTPYSWSLISGGLPPDLSLSTSGIISGTPTTAGTYNFTVLVKDSSSPQQSDSKALSIVVNPASTPTVTSVTPSSGSQGQTLDVTIIGTNFTGATSISFGAGITVNNFTVNSPTQITANISISSTAATGSRDISVITPAGTGTGNSLFTVTSSSTNKSDLIIQNLTVNPASGTGGSSVTVSFTIRNQGNGAANASTTNIRINTSASNVTTSDHLLASISTPSIAAGGSYDATQSVTIPSNRPIGTNYIWVIADVNSTANQSDESNDKANTVFTVQAATGGNLQVSPGDGLTSSGLQGGPFSPSSKTYTLSNTGGSSINWTASKGKSWVSLSATSGTLAAGGNTTVTVSINSNASTLTPDNYSDIISFTNTTNGSGNTTRPVNLTVATSSNQPPTINSLTANPSSLRPGEKSIISVSAADPENDPLSYTWSTSGGTLSSTTGSSDKTWTAPSTPETYIVTVSVTDNKPGHSPVSRFVSISVTGNNPPGSFTLTGTAECSQNNPQIRLTWEASSGVDYYQIYRNGYVIEGTSNNVTTWLDTTVTLGMTYSYFVRAANTGGNTDSNTVNVTANCNIPGIFTLTVTPWCNANAPINKLEWTDSAGRSYPYEIYRNGGRINTQDTKRYDDTDITAGVTYSYYIRAKNSEGSRDTTIVTETARSDCEAPKVPVIETISPQTVTVGSGDFTLTITGSDFDPNVYIMTGFSNPPDFPITPTSRSSSQITYNVTQNSYGFVNFSQAGVYSIQVLNPYPNFQNGQRSNTVQFSVYNPIPVVSSISGSCKANLNCTPANGFDVFINGSGFVSNTAYVAGQYISHPIVEINGQRISPSLLGQGPIYNQMQLYINGSLIPTPGIYTVKVCNAGTSQGTSCSTGSLTVNP